MHLFHVQMPVTHQFPGKQQHWNLVAVAHPRSGIRVDIDDVQRITRGFRNPAQGLNQFLAEPAARA